MKRIGFALLLALLTCVVVAAEPLSPPDDSATIVKTETTVDRNRISIKDKNEEWEFNIPFSLNREISIGREETLVAILQPSYVIIVGKIAMFETRSSFAVIEAKEKTRIWSFFKYGGIVVITSLEQAGSQLCALLELTKDWPRTEIQVDIPSHWDTTCNVNFIRSHLIWDLNTN